MKTLRALRALLRVELRELRRHRARAVLVALLVALPVAGVVGGGALHRITEPTPDETRTVAMGRADLRIDDVGARPLEDVPARLPARARVETPTASRFSRPPCSRLPARARVETLRTGRVELRVPGRRLRARSLGLDPDGLAAGMLVVTSGRAPRPGAAEVALSPLLLDGLGLAVHDTVELSTGPGESSTATVTGVVVEPERLDAAVVLGGAEPSGIAPARPRSSRRLLVGLPADIDAVALAESLRADGVSASARHEHGADDPFPSLAIFVVGGFAFAEAALIIAAAFAVGLRRRQREIGLLAATGASAGSIRASVLLAAATLALAGVVLGTLLGLATTAALHPFLDHWNGRLNGPFEVSGLHVLGGLVLGLAAAVIAAALPARSATRLAVREALAGRRPVATPSSLWLGLGVTLVVVGVTVMGVTSGSGEGLRAVGVLAGSVGAALGLAACSPWLLDVFARRAGPLPLAWRLAVRDAGRFRARHGPVVAAVLGGVSISVMVTAITASLESALAARPALLRDDQLLVDGPAAEDVALALADELQARVATPVAAAWLEGRVLALPGPDGERSAWIACGGDDLLLALALEPGRDAWNTGHMLSLAPERTAETRDALRQVRPGLASVIRPVATDQPVRAPTLAMHATAAGAHGLRVGPPPGHDLVPWIVRLDGAVSAVTLERARLLAADRPGTVVDAERLHRLPERAFHRLVLGLSFLTGLLVLAVATALSTAESAADAAILHTVGAPPQVLREHVAARAGYLAALGCVLAVPAGLLPVVGLFPAANIDLRLSVPWPEIACVVLGLPTFAYVGTRWATRRLPPTWRATPRAT